MTHSTVRWRAAVLLAGALLAACCAHAKTYYWNPTTSVLDSDGKTLRYYWTAAANWLLEDGSAATDYPDATDAEVVFTNGTSSIECYRSSGQCASIAWRGASTTLNQGTLTLVAGGAGLDISEASGGIAFYCDLTLSGTGEVPFDTGTRNMGIQKSFKGVNAILVKRGTSNLTLANDIQRDFNAGGVRLENGTLAFGNLKAHAGNAFDIAFSGNAGTQKVTLNYSDLSIPSLRIREVNGVTNTTHGFNTTQGYWIRHTGGKAAMENSDFSGTLYGNISILWKPYSDATELIFRKATHATTGALVVSNGVLRVTDGASFPSVSGVEVSGATAKLVVEVDGTTAFPAAPIALHDGGTVEVAVGRLVAFAAVATNGAAVADGLYKPVGSALFGTEATWLAGAGRVIVGSLPEAAAVGATWDGAGADTKATTLANWHGAAALPALDDGSAVVDVTGGTGFTADACVWVKGFTNNVAAFTFAPAAGMDFFLGSGGLVNAGGGALALGGLALTAGQTWDLRGGSLTVDGDLVTPRDDLLTIVGTGQNKVTFNAPTPSWRGPVFITNLAVAVNASGVFGPAGAAPAYLFSMPTFAGDVTVDCDLWLCKGGTFNGTVGKTLTFNGTVCSSNTCGLGVSAPAGPVVTFNKLYMSRNGGDLGGAGRIVFHDSVHFRDRPSMSGTVTVELYKDGNRLNGNMGTFGGGTLKCMGAYVVTKANTVRQEKDSPGNNCDGAGINTMINAKKTFTFDLNGYDQSIDQLAMHADGTTSGGHVTSATPARLHLQTSKSYWAQHNYRYGFSDYKTISDASSYGYETADKGYWEDQITLSYEAASGMVRSMMRASSSSGNVEVVSGTLVFLRRAKTSGETFDLKGGSANPYPRLAAEDGAWPNARRVVVSGGILKLEHGQAFGRHADVYIEGTSGKIQLDAGVVQKVHALYCNGVAQRLGTYGSGDSAAGHKDDARFTGAGMLSVIGDGLGTVLMVR